jgi:allantoate deiminase
LAASAGLTFRQDAVGNLWGRIEGREPGPAIVSGSHIDSQCPGGRYDGAIGVIGAIVAVQALIAAYGPPRRPVEIVSLCEEEGSRFPAAGFWGSRAVTGRIASETPSGVLDSDGNSIAEAMASVGLDPSLIATARREDVAAFVELHIEQGPVLEQAGLPVAVVTGITGIRHTEIRLRGEANHAGAFPMDLRHDPMAGFAEITSRLIDHAHRLGRPAVTTVGKVQVWPNAPAIIPRDVTFTIDARHPDPAAYPSLHATHAALIAEVASRRALELTTRIVFDLPPTPCDPAIIDAAEAAARDAGIATLRMASGAGHDSQQIAALCPVGMIFVRSAGGRSHTPEEFSTTADIVEGITVLAGILHRLAWTDSQGRTLSS